MSTPVFPIAVDELPPRKSFPARFAGVFLSPGSTFTDIVRKPDFLAPLIAAVVAAVAVTETMLAKIGMERIVRASIDQSSRASSMSPEKVQQAIEQGARFGAIIAHISGLVGVPIVVLILAGLGLAILNGIFGQASEFQDSSFRSLLCKPDECPGRADGRGFDSFWRPRTFQPAELYTQQCGILLGSP